VQLPDRVAESPRRVSSTDVRHCAAVPAHAIRHVCLSIPNTNVIITQRSACRDCTSWGQRRPIGASPGDSVNESIFERAQKKPPREDWPAWRRRRGPVSFHRQRRLFAAPPRVLTKGHRGRLRGEPPFRLPLAGRRRQLGLVGRHTNFGGLKGRIGGCALAGCPRTPTQFITQACDCVGAKRPPCRQSRLLRAPLSTARECRERCRSVPRCACPWDVRPSH